MITDELVSPNARIASIKRFLAKVPHRTHKLRVVVGGESPIVLGEHDRDTLRPDLAETIEESITDHAAESEATRFDVSCSYVDESGGVVATRVFRYRAPASVNGAVDLARDLDGSTTSILSQMQRHLELQTRTFIVAQQVQVKQLLELNQRLVEMRMSADDEVEELRAENAGLREAVSTASAPADPDAPPHDEVPAKLMALFERYLPVLLMRAQNPTIPPQQ